MLATPFHSHLLALSLMLAIATLVMVVRYLHNRRKARQARPVAETNGATTRLAPAAGERRASALPPQSGRTSEVQGAEVLDLLDTTQGHDLISRLRALGITLHVPPALRRAMYAVDEQGCLRLINLIEGGDAGRRAAGN